MHEHQFGPMGPGPHNFGGFGGFGPAPLWLSALLTGMMLLWWVGVPLLLIWAGSRVLGQRQPAPLPQPARRSASELLRQRYVLGEIDADTFEHMLERVMFSEARERSGHPLIPRGVTGATPGALGRVRIWEPEEQPGASDERDLPLPAPPGDIEIV